VGTMATPASSAIKDDSASSNASDRPALPPPQTPANTKKKFVKRTGKDYSQIWRRSFQSGFLLINVYLGSLFYLWVRNYETGMHTRAVARPAGVEGWLPIAGLMNLKYFLVTRSLPAVHPAAMFLLVTFLAIAFLFHKAFCSWLCPVGTISESLWRVGRRLLRRNFRLPRWIDLPLRGLKYLLLGFFVWAVSSMSAGALADFMSSPYGIVADVKMLNFFRHIGETAAIVIGVLVVASILVQNFWCRYLCPYGALLGLAGFLSPLRIRRNHAACINCAKCTKTCPAQLPVHQLVTIKSAECTGCLECVAVCPAQGALQMAPIALPEPERRALPAWAIAAGIAVLFFGIAGFAKSIGHWDTNLPRSVYLQLVPHADETSHPLPDNQP
jgi:polyferredoxin